MTNPVPVDAQGKQFVVGQQVARAAKMFMVDGLYVKVCNVTRVEGTKVYLDNSRQPLKYPDRVVIL